MASDVFLSEADEQKIIQAIARTEKRTSGEVRVHIEHQCNSSDPLDRAAVVFHDLGMDETDQQNGVLIYIASEDKKAAVYAGKGIHSQVEEDFWSGVLKILLDHFKKGEYESGIEEAVLKVGHKLQELFPHRRDDVNELSDEISYNPNRND